MKDFAMFKFFLKLLGLALVYSWEGKLFKYKYDAIDFCMGRPIHKNMSVAHPNAKIKIS